MAVKIVVAQEEVLKKAITALTLSPLQIVNNIHPVWDCSEIDI